MPVSRLLVLVAAVCALAAAPVRAGEVTGSIVAPTFGSPGVPRMVFSTAGVNGVTGHVFEPGAAGRAFTLRAAGRPTGLEDFDIAFYSSLDATQPVISYDSHGDESGVVPAGGRWAVVTMSAGMNGTFVFTTS